MCCGHRSHHGSACTCGGPASSGRRFWTKQEKAARLEQYLEELQAEAMAVKERIAEMEGG